MRRSVGFVLSIALACGLLVSSVRAEVKPYAKAYYEAKQTQKPLIVIVSMDNCVWCERQKRELRDFRDAVVAEVNLTKSPEYSEYFRASSFPTTYVYGSDMKLKGRVVGYRQSSNFKSLLQ